VRQGRWGTNIMGIHEVQGLILLLVDNKGLTSHKAFVEIVFLFFYINMWWVSHEKRMHKSGAYCTIYPLLWRQNSYSQHGL
jgi:hypothetical protein